MHHYKTPTEHGEACDVSFVPPLPEIPYWARSLSKLCVLRCPGECFPIWCLGKRSLAADATKPQRNVPIDSDSKKPVNLEKLDSEHPPCVGAPELRLFPRYKSAPPPQESGHADTSEWTSPRRSRSLHSRPAIRKTHVSGTKCRNGWFIWGITHPGWDAACSGSERRSAAWPGTETAGCSPAPAAQFECVPSSLPFELLLLSSTPEVITCFSAKSLLIWQ